MVAVIVFGLWGNLMRCYLMRRFDSAITQKHLLTPIGVSAYDFYQKAQESDNSNSQFLSDMSNKVRDRLQMLSDKQFAHLQANSTLTPMEWEELERAVHWLASIDSVDPDIQARKEYVDAERLLLRNHATEALNHFRRALQREPHWGLALIGAGQSCFEEKRYARAEDYYNRAKHISPK